MITDKEVEAARRVLLDNAGLITRKTVRLALEAAKNSLIEDGAEGALSDFYGIVPVAGNG